MSGIFCLPKSCEGFLPVFIEKNLAVFCVIIFGVIYLAFFGVIFLALTRRPTLGASNFGVQKPTLKNCVECGRIFSPMRGEKLCRDCRLKEEELERQVMSYVRDNPGVSIQEAARATGISEKIVKRMAREGMFVTQGFATNITYPCTRCGKPISSGTYCTDCLQALRNETKKVAASMQTKVKSDSKKMSTIDRLNAEATREVNRENEVVKRHFSQGMQDLINRWKVR